MPVRRSLSCRSSLPCNTPASKCPLTHPSQELLASMLDASPDKAQQISPTFAPQEGEMSFGLLSFDCPVIMIALPEQVSTSVMLSIPVVERQDFCFLFSFLFRYCFFFFHTISQRMKPFFSLLWLHAKPMFLHLQNLYCYPVPDGPLQCFACWLALAVVCKHTTTFSSIVNLQMALRKCLEKMPRTLKQLKCYVMISSEQLKKKCSRKSICSLCMTLEVTVCPTALLPLHVNLHTHQTSTELNPFIVQWLLFSLSTLDATSLTDN